MPSQELDTMKCAFDPSATVSDTCISYESINAINDEIYTLLQSLTIESDFFSYYRLNLFNKECPFWNDESSMCGNIACSVNTIESEEDIPLVWRPESEPPARDLREKLPKESPLQGKLGAGVGESCVIEYDDECDDMDYCVPEDEGSTGKGDYVSLVDNPERFTGYAGEGAHQIWNAIYKENCFLKPIEEEFQEQSLHVPLGGLEAVSDFRNVLQKESRKESLRPDGLPFDNECLEKRVFHRLISGMHASISTHLCWDYLNQTTGQWQPNMQCYKERLHDHPERISNMYFNYALVSRAVAKLRKHLKSYTFCTSDPAQDFDTKQRMNQLTDVLARPPKIFNEEIMFQDAAAQGLKEDFRNRFRNVSRLMDCVGCDKCRLWGKLQTSGYGTALKVLFEYDETKNGENPPLRRTELVALINTLGRISHSLAAARSFHEAFEAGHEHASPLQNHVPLVADESQAADSTKASQGRWYHDGMNGVYYEPNEAEWEYQGIRDPNARKPWEPVPRNPDAGIYDEMNSEWEIVRDTLLYVLRSWMDIPRLAYSIFSQEAYRLWAFWLGQPVPPRLWKIQAPNTDHAVPP
ncbi:Endoplasmic reticulum oxidoreductin-1 [Penicillium chermesinum]|nr:Endoplasmic reticulum oxidoreductin-1 [Penicillium chermesinum]